MNASKSARVTIERRVDVHIFSFPMHSIRAQMGQRARARGPKRREMREGAGEIGSGNEIEDGSEGEVGSLERKRERERVGR